MLPILGFNELRYDSKPVAVLAYTAFHHVPDAQLLADPADIDGLTLVGEGGRAGDHSQVGESRKRGNDVLGHPVTKIAKVSAGTQIIEGKNRYGGKG